MSTFDGEASATSPPTNQEAARNLTTGPLNMLTPQQFMGKLAKQLELDALGSTLFRPPSTYPLILCFCPCLMSLFCFFPISFRTTHKPSPTKLSMFTFLTQQIIKTFGLNANTQIPLYPFQPFLILPHTSLSHRK